MANLNTNQPQTPDRAEFRKQYASITLAILSIIQGLAFQALIVKTLEQPRDAFTFELFLFSCHALLCLAIILRVFQTYTSAALAYRAWKTDLWDLLTIFLIGLLEFWLVDTLGTISNNPLPFFRVYLGLSGLAVIGVYRAFLRAPVLEGLTVVMKKREHSIQRHNVWLMSVLMVSALLVVSWSFIELPGLREIAALVSLGGAIALFKRMHWAISDLFRGPQKAIQNIETKSIESSGTPVIELAADTNQSVSVPKPRRKKRSKDS